MIRSFRNKALSQLWATGSTAKIDRRLHRRLLVRLDRLDACLSPEEMNLPGFDFHALKGFDPTRYTVHINGPWCVTFEFEDGDAYRVDFEQYHDK
ncbi:plasmid maintenance system killer [Aurantimonas aggregata]|uniref:Plasmid maintenance system killer n=1 Tax=Aurantimonas aggregata TaxID=2047720 RepID=A0A6L9MII5_9HYPH|nr:plasmid maintenance system killer [Aurantimonas aggregata]